MNNRIFTWRVFRRTATSFLKAFRQRRGSDKSWFLVNTDLELSGSGIRYIEFLESYGSMPMTPVYCPKRAGPYSDSSEYFIERYFPVLDGLPPPWIRSNLFGRFVCRAGPRPPLLANTSQRTVGRLGSGRRRRRRWTLISGCGTGSYRTRRVRRSQITERTLSFTKILI